MNKRDVCDGKKIEMGFDLHFDRELSLRSDWSTGGGALMVVALAAVAPIHGRAVFGSPCAKVRKGTWTARKALAVPWHC